MSWASECVPDGAVLDLGFVSRDRLWDLLAAADVLVQPGGPSPFNDYRFPSKLPDFLACGKPVVLPATNIGRHLADGEEALLLRRGDAAEIFEAVRRLAGDPGAPREARRERAAASPCATSAGSGTSSRSSSSTAGHERRAGRPRVAEAASATSSGSRRRSSSCRSTSRSSTRSPRTTSGGARASPSGRTSRGRRPQFDGHYQPQLPGELGFYDLRDPEVLERQAELARPYGIYGFCFYYYWFDGRRVLERPVDTMLARGAPDFPFCLCWANENWTRRWDGGDARRAARAGAIARAGTERFIRDAPARRSPTRATSRVDGAPLLLVYRANVIPDVERARRALAGDRAARGRARRSTSPPSRASGSATRGRTGSTPPSSSRRTPSTFLARPRERPAASSAGFRGLLRGLRRRHARISSRLELPDTAGIAASCRRGTTPRAAAPTRTSSSARRPDAYETWLRKLVLQTLCRSSVDEPLVFLNAWNEWAEGTHLEPDETHGRALARGDAVGACARRFGSTTRARAELT